MKKFKRIYVEITNVCNLSCYFCPQTERKPLFMEPEAFRTLLEKIEPFTDYIYLHVKGEPLLHPNIGELLDISYQYRMKTNLTTNGTMIREKQDLLLSKPALRQVNFSLHCVTGNDPSRIHDRYMEDILMFINKAREKTGIITSLRLWNIEKGDGLKYKNRGVLEKIEGAFDLPYKIQETVIPSRGIKIADSVYLNQDYEFQWPDLKNKEEDQKGFCYGLRTQAAVLADGTVVPCCLDGEGIINLGNLFRSDFSDILNSPRAQKIYEGFSNRRAEEELCRKCGYRKRFG